MRRFGIGLLILGMAACGRAPEGGPGEAVTNARGVAFTYDYRLRLPSDNISDLQDRHARACERLGPAKCRITGLGYHVDEAGEVSAQLSVALAAPIARTFGREAVAIAEAADGTLIGANITGSDAAGAIDAGNAAGADDAAELARIDGELSKPVLADRERTELRRQRVDLAARVAEAKAGGKAAAAALATTPVSFSYEAGRGTGIRATVTDAGRAALVSVTMTLFVLLWVLANLGPPAIVLAALWLAWRRWGERWWRRAGTAAPGGVDPARRDRPDPVCTPLPLRL